MASHDERSHPLLQQTALSVNPFIDLPKPPTLPHNYTSLPSTLPPSSISTASAPSNPDLPAYVTSASGFAAHPSTIIAQNKALLKGLDNSAVDGKRKVEAWEEGIRERELQEKRRKAPGWLDSETHLLRPEKAPVAKEEETSLMDEPAEITEKGCEKDVNDLGRAMDRAFGRSEMG